VSYYALFQGWLLLSQPTGCLRAPTTFSTEHPLWALSRRSGLFPSWRTEVSPRRLTRAHLLTWAFAVWLGLVTASGPEPIQRPTSQAASFPRTAAPTCISGRTSYLRVRLAFHPYPQVIPLFCNTGGFGPRRGLTRASPCPWVAHPVSGLLPATRTRVLRPVQTRFRSGSTALPAA